MTTTGAGVPVSVGVNDGGKEVGVAVGDRVGVWVQVGMAVAVAVAVAIAVGDCSPGSDDNAAGVALLVGVGREAQVAVGPRTGVTVVDSAGVNEVSIIAGTRCAPALQIIIPHNNTTRPNAGSIRLLSSPLNLPIAHFQPQPPSIQSPSSV